MDYESTQRYVREEFDKTCDGCGCKFHVGVSSAPEQEVGEEYKCPSCGKAFPVAAALPPDITPLENCGN